MGHVVKHSIVRLLDETLVSVILSPTARQQFALGHIGQRELKPLAELIEGLSEQYRKDKELTPISEQQAAAYALYYTPLNFIKTCFLLGQLRSVPQASSTPLRLLDYGCGPGTASLAALALIPSPLHITAVDSSSAMRNIASRLVPEFASALPETPTGKLVQIQTAAKMPTDSTTFDIVIAANVLNELDEELRFPLVSSLISKLSSQGILILLEPALLSPTRSLMKVRDSILNEAPSLTPIFPCTHRNQCPMLQQTSDDWCHGSLEGMGRDFLSSELVRQFDSLLGFNKHRIKYAAMVLQNNEDSPSGYRVLRDAVTSKRGVDLSVCGPNHFGPVAIRKSNLSDQNRAARKAKQYDRLTVLNGDITSVSSTTQLAITNHRLPPSADSVEGFVSSE